RFRCAFFSLPYILPHCWPGSDPSPEISLHRPLPLPPSHPNRAALHHTGGGRQSGRGRDGKIGFGRRGCVKKVWVGGIGAGGVEMRVAGGDLFPNLVVVAGPGPRPRRLDPGPTTGPPPAPKPWSPTATAGEPPPR